MDTLLMPLLQSPRLPDYIRELSDYLKEEQEKRTAFYENTSDDEKAEFINGEIICHSPAKEKHNRIVFNLTLLLAAFVKQNNLGVVRFEKALVQLMRNDFEPAIFFFRKEVADTFTGETMFYPVPDFVVEVLSESTEKRDRGIKMEDYGLNGVTEYWIIDPDDKTIEQYTLNETVLTLKSKIDNGTIRCEVLKGLAFNIEQIF